MTTILTSEQFATLKDGDIITFEGVKYTISGKIQLSDGDQYSPGHLYYQLDRTLKTLSLNHLGDVWINDNKISNLKDGSLTVLLDDSR